MTVSFQAMFGERISSHCTTLQLIDEIENDYSISLDAQALCDTYYLLHWSGVQLLSKLRKGAFTILKNDILFHVKWNGAANQQNCINAERVAMSFRRMRGSNSGIVIPKVIHGMRAP